MAFKPTQTQEKAIKTRGNVLVSAAAGSGKTAVLVERVINMLCDKNSSISADKLLIVTFTNAAAAEMRSRIEKRLYEVIQKNPDDTSLQRQKYLLSSADICTIDSFCIKLVRENFEKCGIEPDFKISDGSGQSDIGNTVMKNLITEHLDNPSQDFIKLLELTNCEYDEKNLTELISRIYLYSQQMPFPDNFVARLVVPYEKKFESGNPWYDMAFEIAKKRFESLKLSVQKMIEVAPHINRNHEKFIAYADKTLSVIEKLDEVLSQNLWNNFAKSLSEITFDRVPLSDKGDSSADVFKRNNKFVKDTIKSLQDVFSCSSELMQDFIVKNYGAVKLLTELVTQYGVRLFQAFREENTYTFYNMEQLALNLLCEHKDGEVIIRDEARELCNRYDEVLVDEFQDVNDLQNTLFYVLSNREEKLFVVGDVKQSIYGFRGSNPDNFLNKKNLYMPINAANDNDSKKIILSDNFRSRKGVCEVINFFFSLLLGGQCGGIVYNEEERLNARGIFPDSNAPQAELLVIDKYDSDDGQTLLETEAQHIAEYILSVMDEGEVISNGDALRKARFSDFAILLDKVKDKASVIAQVLSNYGVPVSLCGESFMESIEVSTVMSLLQVIDNPKCDVELLTVMMSPIFAFTAEKMAIIRANQKYGSLYSAVVEYSKTNDRKTKDFIESLANLRRDAAVMSVDRLILKLLHSADILNQMSALPGGKGRRANLFALVKFAKGYCEHTGGGIYGFLRYMNALPETAFKTSVSGGENAVKIMSMHNSKGLQFPICIVANLSSQINNADSVSRVLFSEKGGIAFKYYDEENRYDVEMLGHTVMSDAANSKTTEEKLRLLYVAMTRAVDRLCLVCANKNLESKVTKLSAELLDKKPYISRELLENSRSMGDWLLAAALLHPQGKKLCDYASVKVNHIASDSDFKISIFNDFNKDVYVSEQQEITISQCDYDLAEKIKANTSFVYPYEKLRFLQAKASVSALVHGAEGDRFAFVQKPAFMQGNHLSGAARGTALHHVMQFINFSNNVDVEAEMERLLEWKFITEQEASSVDLAVINQFFESDVYRRIINSCDVRREMRFLTEIPAKQLDGSLDYDLPDANIIVQGAVDLCFVENDGIVVLDFKTDRVDNMNELIACYGEQLNIYAAAAEKIFEKPVKEKIIYSFSLGKSISF